MVETNLALWTVSPEGDDDQCEYLVFNRRESRCGPDNRFRSFMTDNGGNIFSSSLSVSSVTADLNGTSIVCSDGDDNFLGSAVLCITGEATLYASTDS